jgi:hypothetical protein
MQNLVLVSLDGARTFGWQLAVLELITAAVELPNMLSWTIEWTGNSTDVLNGHTALQLRELIAEMSAHVKAHREAQTD